MKFRLFVVGAGVLFFVVASLVDFGDSVDVEPNPEALAIAKLLDGSVDAESDAAALGLAKLIDAAREDRGRGFRELDLSKPLPEFIMDGPYEVAVDIRLALNMDSPELLEILLRDQDVNTVDENGDTVLHRAADYGASSSIQLLLERGAERDARDAEDRTPLILACEERSEESVDALLAAGASVDAVATDGTTALNVAVRWRETDTVEKLLTAGARADGPGGDFAPFEMAIRWGAKESLALLKKRGGVPALAASDLNKRLRDVVNSGATESAAMLLELGADRSAGGDSRISAIAIAEIMNEDRPGSYQDMVDLLKSYRGQKAKR